MFLTIKDRLMLIGMLPSEGNLSDMTEIYDLVRALRIEDPEKNYINYREVNGSIVWDADKAKTKEITLTSAQKRIINDAINKLDKNNQIGLNQIETIMKIKNG